jgi:tetratricopeptide (TPR) repeat protein
MSIMRNILVFLVMGTLSACGAWDGYRLGEIDQQIANGDISITEGIRALEVFLEENPESGSAHAMLASIYLDLENYGLVQEHFALAQEKGASDFQIDVLNAKIAYLREEWAKAGEYFEDAIVMEPGDGLLFYRAAQSWYRAGDFEKAYDLAVQSYTILGESPAAASLTLRIGMALRLPLVVLEPWLGRSEGSPELPEVTTLWEAYQSEVEAKE